MKKGTHCHSEAVPYIPVSSGRKSWWPGGGGVGGGETDFDHTAVGDERIPDLTSAHQKGGKSPIGHIQEYLETKLEKTKAGGKSENVGSR